MSRLDVDDIADEVPRFALYYGNHRACDADFIGRQRSSSLYVSLRGRRVVSNL